LSPRKKTRGEKQGLRPVPSILSKNEQVAKLFSLHCEVVFLKTLHSTKFGTKERDDKAGQNLALIKKDPLLSCTGLMRRYTHQITKREQHPPRLPLILHQGEIWES